MVLLGVYQLWVFIRGGYAEVVNMDDDVMALLQKSISAKLCPTVLGQSCMDIVANPPKPGEPSYDSWLQEKEVRQNKSFSSKTTVRMLSQNAESDC